VGDVQTMTASALERHQTLVPRRLRRFFWTPKGLLLVILTGVTALAVRAGGASGVEAVLLATVTAAFVDVAWMWGLRDKPAFPSGALLTGMIVALVLSPHERLAVILATAALAIIAKQLLRTRSANVFNPAALALVVSSLAFGTEQSWWGALPDLGLGGVIVVLVTGVFIADRVNKLPLVLAFLGAYFLLFTVATFAGSDAAVAEVFRRPDMNAALFFALFMLDDPPTCPVRYRDQVLFALIVAVGSFLCFMLMGAVYFLLAGLLVGNLWEAARRTITSRSRRGPRSIDRAAAVSRDSGIRTDWSRP
jgi:Na+-translocating ferredoxin:NAD+ oxidoreductase RnfD subunit